MKNDNLDINNTKDGLNCRLETAEKRIGKRQKRAKEMIHNTEQRQGDENTDRSVKQYGR